ncbi:glycosyltransferase family 9 protein [Desulfohalobiaceae bacterium Ax17]|uniref:glycosyltransferase family 9 protein n=1 Tax=Desulfovulcanus ferrireducens TaxID=2831190 RepID=UPI00207BCE7E|nr:glycosyltransferase family 9 protein [Desulfovulcanus ferrireducens]MBT8764200.1 glycosyltransferase family 9 protein [Desulfovulcanus ferrireducens]
MVKPILVLQMQRMGDLILSFPLFLWLSRTYHHTPVWTVAEEDFFQGLMPISPQVVYVPWNNYSYILKEKYSLVINLSHRREAAWLAGQIKADEKIGPYLDRDDYQYIAGKWQLYRASLVQSNRHNRFHWADLNALDVIPFDLMKSTIWPEPRILPSNGNKVGLFLGASERSKRPSARFWSLLAQRLIEYGLRPVFLGGKAEVELAERVKSDLDVRVLDLTGQLSLDQLVRIGQTLQLLVTPDTGPMHLAAWTGLRVLNLSMGPVNPWETGPYQPGHLVLRANLSCRGCWTCKFTEPKCGQKFDPRKIAFLVKEIVFYETSRLGKTRINGLELFTTQRTGTLYHLLAIHQRFTLSDLFGQLWRSFWGYHFGLWAREEVFSIAEEIRAKHPLFAKSFQEGLFLILDQIKRVVRTRQVPEPDFWSNSPPMLRPLTSYIHLFWQNTNFTPASLKKSLDLVEEFYSMFDVGF